MVRLLTVFLVVVAIIIAIIDVSASTFSAIPILGAILGFTSNIITEAIQTIVWLLAIVSIRNG